ncbi:hypothetical protein [Xanthomonas sacchari]|uniref:hypothetical protein n=1 Tax=Xanthomonas sacchari TaxID=56458 RepID=UPI0012E0619C|nr:hypothetical protein [Xanthomonas sacchari]
MKGMGDLTDYLDPHYRLRLLSQAAPQVWAATFALHLEKGENAAAEAADAAVGVVKRLKDEPLFSLEGIVAKSGFVFSFDDFRDWYRVAHRLRQPLTSSALLRAINAAAVTSTRPHTSTRFRGGH